MLTSALVAELQKAIADAIAGDPTNPMVYSDKDVTNLANRLSEIIGIPALEVIALPLSEEDRRQRICRLQIVEKPMITISINIEASDEVTP